MAEWFSDRRFRRAMSSSTYSVAIERICASHAWPFLNRSGLGMVLGAEQGNSRNGVENAAGLFGVPDGLKRSVNFVVRPRPEAPTPLASVELASVRRLRGWAAMELKSATSPDRVTRQGDSGASPCRRQAAVWLSTDWDEARTASHPWGIDSGRKGKLCRRGRNRYRLTKRRGYPSPSHVR